MKILVTGSEGNIGIQLVKYLLSKEHEVLCLDIKQLKRSNYIFCNILNLIDVEKEIEKFNPEVVYHLAAMANRVICEQSIITTTNVNVIGTLNVIQLCKKINAKLINFSTSEVYGNQDCLLEEDIIPKPNNVYGLTKYMAEQLIEYEFLTSQLRYINVRPFMLYNEFMDENISCITKFIKNLNKNISIDVYTGSKRSWMHISDAVVLFEKLLYIDDNITINIGDLNFIDIKDLAVLMCNYMNKPLSLIIEKSLPEKMTLKKISSFSKQQSLLNYNPEYTIEKGIKKIIEYEKKI